VKSTNKEDLIKLVENFPNIKIIEEKLDCSRNTVRHLLKKFSIKTPKGFFSTGKKQGRPKGFCHSESWKEQHRERMNGENNPFFGKQHSNKTKKKMSKNHANFEGDKNPFKKALLKYPEKVEEHKDRCKELWENRDEKWRHDFGKKLQTGHNDITGSYWSRAKSNAKKRKLDFLIDIKFAWELFLKQDKKCKLTGLPIEMGRGGKFGNETTASLDRIDSTKGYTEDNVQWVHKNINRMKWHFDEKTFKKLCRLVIEKDEQ